MPNKPIKLFSWNVNGIRSILKKGFHEFVDAHRPDILCLQETKASEDQISDVEWPTGYRRYWHSAQKKGYSGTGIMTKIEPASVSYGIGIPEHDNEGRVITMGFDDFYLVNVYTPNSQRELTRLNYRTREWEPDFRRYLKALEKSKPVIVCGDLNVAHREIDLANPKTNTKNAGFTPEERACMDDLQAAGFVDTFRIFEKSGGHYTWWSYMNQSRERNIGWRIDYFLVSEPLKQRVASASIHPEVMGSDHCPVSIHLKP